MYTGKLDVTRTVNIVYTVKTRTYIPSTIGVKALRGKEVSVYLTGI